LGYWGLVLRWGRENMSRALRYRSNSVKKQAELFGGAQPGRVGEERVFSHCAVRSTKSLWWREEAMQNVGLRSRDKSRWVIRVGGWSGGDVRSKRFSGKKRETRKGRVTSEKELGSKSRFGFRKKP